MMAYLFEDGRIIYDASLLTQYDDGKYLTLENPPEIERIEGKVGVIVGCNLKTGEINIEYFDIPKENEFPQELQPQPTETQILMQTLADVELSNIEAQQGRQMLAQQIADLELMILERGDK